MHLIAVHLLCGAVDRCVERLEGEREPAEPREGAGRRRWGRLVGGGVRR
jgi:hypothetical protein